MENLGINIKSFFNGKRVFLTGHTGFKGAWLMAWLHLLGARVKGYSLEPEPGQSLYYDLAPHIPHENVFGDILDREKLSAELNAFRPDVIFHLAAQALVRRSYRIPAETFDVNTVGTANLLEAVHALPGKVAVILITTDKVYENREIDYHYKEDDRLGGYDPYSASKAAAELVIDSFRNSFFNPATIDTHQKILVSARAGNVIGGGDWNEDRLVPDIVRYLRNGQPIQVRNPASVRPWQHVLEPLGGYLIAAMKTYSEPLRYSGAYNFGPLKGDHLKVEELVRFAIDCWGMGSWEDKSDSSQPHEAGLLKLDVSKAFAELDWKPRLNSQEAVEWTINWYKEPAENRLDFTLSQIDKYLQL
jgi:CDP-glucose 4,6-dehydratase